MKIVIISTSYNCEKYIQKCFDSVFSQNYKNFFWTIIDDNSNDNTFSIIKYNIKNKNNVKCIFNKKRKGKLTNIYSAIGNTNIDINDIIISLDADDQLYNQFTLQKIYNEYVQNKFLLLTYGTYVIPKQTKSLIAIGKNTALNFIHKYLIKPRRDENDIYYYRKKKFLFSHLKTFKYKLFKKIKKEDLIDEKTGKYFDSAIDVALMLPMLEMCGNNSIKQMTCPTYIYTINNVFSFHNKSRKKQKDNEKKIRSKKPYPVMF
jgi:glycosyltransferase involved in cell wall biosynthesis